MDISLSGLLIGYFLSIVILAIHQLKKTGLSKKYGISLVRMTLQLFFLGLVLQWIMDTRNIPVLAVLTLLMLLAATQLIVGGSGVSYRKFFLMIFTVSSLSTLAAGGVLLFGVIGLPLKEWNNPRYIIPILGMLLGNTMNSGVISLRNLEQSIKSQRKIIEQKLSYGAKPTEAVLKYIREAYKLALLPHISSMAGMGVVSLPGMMTGQVLSGTDVMTAVKYQIAIVLGITAVAAVSNYILLHYAHKKYFNPREQMLGVESGKKSN